MRREELLAAPPRGRVVTLESGWVLPLDGGGSSLLPLGRGWVSPLDGGGSSFLPLDGGGSSLLPLGRGWVSRLEGANSQPLEYVARLVFFVWPIRSCVHVRASEFFKKC